MSSSPQDNRNTGRLLLWVQGLLLQEEEDTSHEISSLCRLGLARKSPPPKQERRRWLPELPGKSVSYREPELAHPEAERDWPPMS